MTLEKDMHFGRIHDLTIEEVKACAPFSHFTDEQALEVIETLKLFSKISFDCYEKEVKKL